MIAITRRRTVAILAPWVLLAVASAASGATIIGELTDPPHPAEDEYIDILSARVEQDGGLLTFIIETRGPIPTTLGQPDESLMFIWLVDADQNPATGQPHEGVGTEFNVRAVIGELYGGAFVDRTGDLPGGGLGTVVVDGNEIRLTIGLAQIANPSAFDWSCDAAHVIDNVAVSANHETAVALATPLPYVAPARVVIKTPLLMLCPSGPASAPLQIEVRDAAGNVLNNDDYHIVCHSSSESVATVDSDGVVTALAVPVQLNETPFVDVSVDGLSPHHVAVIRVTDTDLGVTHQTYAGEHVSFYLPAQIEGVDLDAITTQFQVVAATDLAYAAQNELTGVTPFEGEVQWFLLDVSNDPNTLPCGASGNPIRLGWQFGKPVHNSCYIVNWPEDRGPQWGVIFHELGHNMTWPSWGFGQFCSSGSPSDWKYSEALASVAGAWSWCALRRCPGSLSPSIVEGMGRDYRAIDPGERYALATYLANGAVYEQADPDVICDIFWALYDDYGMKVWYDFFSTFTPTEDPLPVTLDTEAKQATWLVAAVSASAGEDLRARFAGEYGFPIDDDAWPDILANVQARIDARPWRPPALADYDCDGDVDLADFAVFLTCFNGPNREPAQAACDVPDADADNDVDLADFAVFLTCFNGPSRPPACPT